MRFRICRFLLDNGEFETVVTSLPRAVTLEDIKELYHLRWGIETSSCDLDYTLGLVSVHGESDMFAEQETYAGLTAFNFASRVCREIVVRQPSEGIYAYKVNFKMAVTLCKEYIRTPKADGEKLLTDIAQYAVHRSNQTGAARPVRPTGKGIPWFCVPGSGIRKNEGRGY